MMRTRWTRAAAAGGLVVLAAIALSGCGWRGLNSIPLPGTKGGGPGSYTIHLHYLADYSLFPDAIKKAYFAPFTPWSGEVDSKGVAFTISK